MIGLLTASACMVMLVFCLSLLAGAVELTAVLHVAGSGYQSFNFTGDNLSVFTNGSYWNATAVTP